jgi:hypothetical protein
MPRIQIIACCVCLLFSVSATPAGPAVNSAVNVQIIWLDWPSKDVSKQQANSSADYRDSNLEANLARIVFKTLAEAGVQTHPNADLIMRIHVTGTTIDTRYTDSVFGTVNNRPSEYAGEYTAEVQRGKKTVSRHRAKFSFRSSTGSGQTNTTISKMKVTGLVKDWLAGYVETRKFRKALDAQPSS